MNDQDFFIEWVIITICYILWPLLLIVLLFVSKSKNNTESFRLSLKALFFWLVMLATTTYQIVKGNNNNEKQWFDYFCVDILGVAFGFIVFLPPTLAIAFTAVGIASIAKNK